MERNDALTDCGAVILRVWGSASGQTGRLDASRFSQVRTERFPSPVFFVFCSWCLRQTKGPIPGDRVWESRRLDNGEQRSLEASPAPALVAWSRAKQPALNTSHPSLPSPKNWLQSDREGVRTRKKVQQSAPTVNARTLRFLLIIAWIRPAAFFIKGEEELVFKKNILYRGFTARTRHKERWEVVKIQLCAVILLNKISGRKNAAEKGRERGPPLPVRGIHFLKGVTNQSGAEFQPTKSRRLKKTCEIHVLCTTVTQISGHFILEKQY